MPNSSSNSHTAIPRFQPAEVPAHQQDIQIFVEICSGKTIAFEVGLEYTVKTVYAKIMEQEQVGRIDQKSLIFAGKLMDFSQKLVEFNIPTNSTLRLVDRIRGGAKPSGPNPPAPDAAECGMYFSEDAADYTPGMYLMFVKYDKKGAMKAKCYVDGFEQRVHSLDDEDIFPPDPSVTGKRHFEEVKKGFNARLPHSQAKKARATTVAKDNLAPHHEQPVYRRLGPVSILGRKGYVLSSCRVGSEGASNLR
jgi:hypothetical protein